MACALVGATIIVNPNRVGSWRKPKSLIEYLLGADPRCICDCCPYGEAISSAIIVDFFFGLSSIFAFPLLKFLDPACSTVLGNYADRGQSINDFWLAAAQYLTQSHLLADLD
jgi:hypothetical protein